MNAKPRLTEYWVTCADGLGNLITTRTGNLGIQNIQRFAGRLILKHTGKAYRVCMWSRLASRVVLPIHTHEVEFTRMMPVMWRKNSMRVQSVLFGL